MSMLLEKGVDVDAAGCINIVHLLSLLLEAGADIDARDKSGRTP